MRDVPVHQADSPALQSPWWWSFFLGPLAPTGSPKEQAPERGPVVVPAPGTAPGFGPDEPDPDLEPGPYDDDEIYSGPPMASVASLRTSAFAAVTIVVLMFFFAIMAAPGW